MSASPVRALVLAICTVVAFAVSACGPAGEPSLTRSAWPVTLAGSSWTAIRVGDQATVAGSEPTATFTADKLDGTGGCNHYFGSYEYARGVIKVANMGATAMACLAAGIGDIEQRFFTAMQGASSVSIDPDGRMIIDGSGGSITFTVAPQQSS
jgi:heat shock protein HslJ